MFKPHLSCINFMLHICSQPFKSIKSAFLFLYFLTASAFVSGEESSMLSYFSSPLSSLSLKTKRSFKKEIFHWLTQHHLYCDECQFSPSLLVASSLLSYNISNNPLFLFSVSRLGSDLSVYRKYVIHMHLRIIHYEYGVVNQTWLYVQGYIYIFWSWQHVDYEHCEKLL